MARSKGEAIGESAPAADVYKFLGVDADHLGRQGAGEAEGAGAANRIRANADREVTIIKAEANAEGTNRRAVITNRPGARVLPGAALAGTVS